MIHIFLTTTIAMLTVLAGGMALTGLSVAIAGDFHDAMVLLGCAGVGGVGYMAQRRWSNSAPSTNLAVNSAAVAIGWFVSSIYATFPIWIIALISGAAESDTNRTMIAHQSFLNAWYDGTASITSGGLTSTLRSSELTPAIQLWRSVGQWIGGIGMAVVATRLIASNQQSWTMYRGETRQWTAGSLDSILRRIVVSYLLLTAACGGMFWIVGMPTWESINHGLIIVSTGGLTVVDDSFASYSWGLQAIACLFMLLGAASFSAIHVGMTGKWRALFHRSDVRAYVTLAVLGVVTLAVLSWTSSDSTIWQVWFNGASAMTTCGVSSGLVSRETEAIQLCFVTLMLIGGCSDSTAGGLKVNRVLWLFKVLRTELRRGIHPDRRAILPRWDRRSLSEASFHASTHHCIVILLLGLLTFLSGVLVLRLSYSQNVDLMQILFQSASASSTVGLSMDLIGPDRPAVAKTAEIFLMISGRLEWMAVVLIPFVFGNRASGEQCKLTLAGADVSSEVSFGDDRV